MLPVLATLLLTATTAAGSPGDEAVPDALPPVPVPAVPGNAQPLPEATTEQGPARPAAQHPPVGILAQDSRLDAYAQFRALYEAGSYEEALTYARQVVELSERGDDPDYELPIAYNNLGATQYQLSDYPGAEESYRKSLDMLESTQGISSRRLVVPLAGLGAAYAAQDQHQAAALLFERALAVSRRADGLFNLQQIPLIKQSADSRYAIQDFSGAERDYLYALKVSEQNFGYRDTRTIPPLLELGAFYEGLREFIAARMTYMRARDAALDANPGYSAEAVKSLTGIARSYRLQYTIDPDSLMSQDSPRDDFSAGRFVEGPRMPSAPADRGGLKAAQHALELLRATPDPPSELVTQTLIELGDWYQATSRPAMSLPYYVEAAGILDARAESDPLTPHPLRAPRMVFYRPPVSASRGTNTLGGRHVIRKAVFSFVVTASGEPQGITVVSSDMNEDQLELTRRALARAIYSPRIAGGQAVETAGITFTGEWYEELPDQAPPPEDERDSGPGA